MQFKNPEVFYFLFLLLIPLIVHLFQLQKFQKVRFTNVAFLKQLSLQNRKSSKLKKWLILATRSLGLLAILFIFSQPYFSSKDYTKTNNVFVYIDNSISTKAHGKRGELLSIAVQDIVENSTSRINYFLATNDLFLKNISKNELSKQLKNLHFTAKSRDSKEIELLINQIKNNKTKSLDKVVLISDFQNFTKNKSIEFTNVKNPIFIKKLTPETQNNISVKSLVVKNTNNNQINIVAEVKNQGNEKNNIPIALYNNKKLLSKRSFSIEKNTTKEITFSVQKEINFNGKIEVTFNDTFNFDNSLYFSFTNNQKINVLSIGNESNFLPRIFTKEEFNFNQTSIQNINYNSIQNQNLIILNEVEILSNSLQNILKEFLENNGSLIVIPSSKLNYSSFNRFFSQFGSGSIKNNVIDSIKITQINFDHPLYSNVFSKKITNFQYPVVLERFTSTFKGSPVISFSNNKPFLEELQTKNGSLFWFSSPLKIENTNFSNSPLIVPTFYNLGINSLAVAKPFYRLGEENKIDIAVNLKKDEILSIKNSKESFIPLQQLFQNKVTLSTNKKPLTPGFYDINNKEQIIKTIAFNYPEEESSLNFLNISASIGENNNIKVFESLQGLFEEINNENEVQWLWKLFLAIAIVSLLLEILILKFFKT